MHVTNLQTGEQYCAKAGQSLMELLRQNHIFPPAPCGGKGHCGKCKIRLFPADTPVSQQDSKHLSAEELAVGYRLACTFHVTDEIGFYPPEEEKATVLLLKQADFQFLQVAVDIGTTTIEMALLNEKREKLALLSMLNRQQSFGADVISRIQYTIDHPDGLTLLHQILINQLNEMIQRLKAAYGCREVDIQKAVISANTTLVHLLLCCDPRSLASYPFTPLVKGAQILPGKELSLSVAEVSILPCISAYIGADITAVIHAFDLTHVKENTLVADIGTNGEMVLAANGQLFACSTAAGPAFEGANIACGIGGVPGGICRVRLQNNRLQTETIDHQPPVGLCGSGAVDLLAILLELGIVDRTGAISECSALPSTTAMKIYRQTFRILHGEKRIYLTQNIWLSEKDIREFQLAKSAIRSGLQTLLNHAKMEDPDKVIITGGLGTHLNLSSAVHIGMLPIQWQNVIETAPSGALEGTILCADPVELEKTRQYDAGCRYIDLATDPDFSRLFIENMLF